MALALPVRNIGVPQFVDRTTVSQAKIDSSKDEDQSNSNVKLPDGFPRSMDVDFAWSGSNLSADQYIYHFTESDKLEIAAALASFKGAKKICCLHFASYP